MRRLALAAALVILAALPVWAGGTFYINIASQILLYAIFALGINILVGYAGLVSLGHAGLLGIAAYGAARILTGGHGHLACFVRADKLAQYVEQPGERVTLVGADDVEQFVQQAYRTPILATRADRQEFADAVLQCGPCGFDRRRVEFDSLHRRPLCSVFHLSYSRCVKTWRT